ncbi:hypothetical protein O3301_14045 [Janthinobacterium sp. SUN211]|uniref:hypothetical protein n=1 Tax=Janthinobacterium sp. SUN211 TaxID=3014786 RepID=UPI0027129B7C|nr:hypothetical protein [Janthinobacterium sp. SUN211]MDO8049585.1 hypothetical protein [Janthinobacterium sp. SUN211]
MLNWSQLSFQQRLWGAIFLSWIFGALYAVCFPDQPHARLPQAGLPLLMLGFLLHPRCFAGGRGAFSWSSAPVLVKGLWLIGSVVGSISAADSLLGAMAGR